MKFHALSLCLAGTLATSVAQAAQQNDPNKPHHSAVAADRVVVERSTMSGANSIGDGHNMPGRVWTRRHDVTYRYPIFPEVVSVPQVGQQVAIITENNRREAAELRALASRARTGGFENIAAVYDYMAGDHMRNAGQATSWLTAYNYPVPAEPTIALAADMSPEASVDHMIDMHMRSFNESLDKMDNERSSTVRGMHLLNAATSARHISLLRTLDDDVAFGRRTLSARLRSEMEPSYVASRSREEWIATIIEEHRTAFPYPTYNPPVAIAEVPETPAPVAPAPQIVERERIVERIVEKPVIVERIVEKPVYITRPAVSSRVAGRRQMLRGRRPAK